PGVPPRSPGQTALVELGTGRVDAVQRLLLRDPLDERRHPLLERDLRLEPEQVARLRDVRVAVADVAGPVATDELGLDVDAEVPRERARDLEHRRRPPGADVHGLAVRAVGLERE